MASDFEHDINWIRSCLDNLSGKIKDGFAISVCNSPLRDNLIEYLGDKSLLEISWEQLNAHQRDILSDACYDILRNDAPIVFEYELEQDFGPYSAFIRGVNGCYFLDVLERDPIGPFGNIDLAKQAFDFGFGELLVRNENDK